MGRQGGLLPPCGVKRVVRRRGTERPPLPRADGLCLFAGLQLERGVAGIPCWCEAGENGSCPPVREKCISKYKINLHLLVYATFKKRLVLLVGMSTGPLVGLASAARRTGGGLTPCNPCSSELDQDQS